MSDLFDDKEVPAVVKEEVHTPDSNGKSFPSVVEEVCTLDACTSELVDGKAVPPVVEEEVQTLDADGQLFPLVVEEVCTLKAFPAELADGKEFPTVVEEAVYTIGSDCKLFPPAVDEACTLDAFPSELVDGQESPAVVKEEVYTLGASPLEVVDREEFPPIVKEVRTPDAFPSELVDGKEFLQVVEEVCTPDASLSELADGNEFPPVDKEEPCPTFHLDEENSQPPPELCTEAAEIDDIEYYTISGTRPYFSIILTKAQVNSPFHLFLPVKIVGVLPPANVPVVLTSHGKRWHTCYLGDKVGKTFASSWRTFVLDNDLKVGDCCFFELMECNTSSIEFKVIIIKSQTTDGDTPQTAIVIE